MRDATDITDDDIRALRREADLHLDHAQVLICDAALGDPEAQAALSAAGFRQNPRAECARVKASAAAAE